MSDRKILGRAAHADEVKAAFGLSGPRPAPRAFGRVFTHGHGAAGWRAADGFEPLGVQRMLGDVMFLEIRFGLLTRPVCERMDARDAVDTPVNDARVRSVGAGVSPTEVTAATGPPSAAAVRTRS